jgi:hypothetical protein
LRRRDPPAQGGSVWAKLGEADLRKVTEKSATTGRAGGMRKAPGRGRVSRDGAVLVTFPRLSLSGDCRLSTRC